MGIERRVFAADQNDLESDGTTFHGKVTPYGTKTWIGPPKRGFYEQILPGAFDDSLSAGKRDVVAVFNHNPDNLLGRTSAGTLRLESRDDGFYDEIDFPDTTLGRDVRELVKRKDVRGQSFAFQVPPGGDTWELAPGGHAQLRSILKVDLFDVGPVTMPAYADTTADMRSLDISKIAPEVRGGLLVSVQDAVGAAEASVDAALIAAASGNPAQAVANLTAGQIACYQAMDSVYFIGLDSDDFAALGLPDIAALISTFAQALGAAIAGGAQDATQLAACDSAGDACMKALNVPDPDDANPLPGQEGVAADIEEGGLRTLSIERERLAAFGLLWGVA